MDWGARGAIGRPRVALATFVWPVAVGWEKGSSASDTRAFFLSRREHESEVFFCRTRGTVGRSRTHLRLLCGVAPEATLSTNTVASGKTPHLDRQTVTTPSARKSHVQVAIRAPAVARQEGLGAPSSHPKQASTSPSPYVLANVSDEPCPVFRAQFIARLSVSGREGHHSHEQDVECEQDAESGGEICPHVAEHDKVGGQQGRPGILSPRRSSELRDTPSASLASAVPPVTPVSPRRTLGAAWRASTIETGPPRA
jgi:hypothetical protein